MDWNTSCHCGAVSMRLAKAPDEVAECNCSLCFSHGILWAYMSPRDVVIEGPTQTYNRADRPNPIRTCISVRPAAARPTGRRPKG